MPPGTARIIVYTRDEGTCPVCSRASARFYHMTCDCCSLNELCCPGCASPDGREQIRDYEQSRGGAPVPDRRQ